MRRWRGFVDACPHPSPQQGHVGRESPATVRSKPECQPASAQLQFFDPTRFFGSLKSECLDRLILFGERSLRNACREYVSHYHGERNHHDKQQSSQAEPEKAAFEFGGGAVGAWIRCMACIPSPGASRCGVEKESADSSDPSTSERRYTSSRRGTTSSAIGA
jgi:hypothetical protein